MMRAEPKKARGGAIISVLLMSALLLFIGLALGTLSSISLNMAKRQMETLQGSLLAQSAYAQLQYMLFMAREQARRDGLDVTASARPDFVKLFQGRNLTASRQGYFPGTCELAFQGSGPYYCVDNSNSEYPAKSWQDAGAARSVPPFSVLLVLKTVQGGAVVRFYEAVLEWQWEYAAFCAMGPILLTGIDKVPSGDRWNPYAYYRGAPTTVSGGVFTFFDPNNPEQVTGPSDLDSPYLFPRRALSYRNAVNYSVKVGRDTESPGMAEADEGNALLGNACIFKTRMPQGMYTTTRAADPVVVNKGNEFNGRKRYLRGAGNLGPGQNPTDFVRRPETASFKVIDPFAGYRDCLVSFQPSKGGIAQRTLMVLGDPEAATETNSQGDTERDTRRSDGFGYSTRTAVILRKDLELTGTASASRFFLDGNLSNCVYFYQPSFEMDGRTVHWVRKSALYAGTGLKLRNCVLFVNGDVTLSEMPAGWINDDARAFDRENVLDDVGRTPGGGSALAGDNATLVVNGVLTLTGGSLDSKDKGMVIFARDIRMASKGDFKGLIMASEGMRVGLDPAFASATSTPTPGSRPAPMPSATPAAPVGPPLTIRGGIICGGKVAGHELKGLELVSTRLIYDPRYLKSVHGFGEMKIAGWRALP